MLSTLLQVALGGAIGSIARYLSGLAISRYFAADGFPVAILSVNIVGSFLMGLLVASLSHRAGGAFAPFVLVGVLGGFTTFSSFSLEAVTLFERGLPGQALLYIAASVGCALAGLALGVWVARGIGMGA